MEARTIPVDRKLAAARARLALERPFIGALVMHLPLVAAEGLRTIGTDAHALYFNPRFIERLSFAQTQFVLAHEALHCALGHFHRGRHRLRARWDRACDYCVNQLLTDEGLSPPEGALVNPAYRGLAAEEIYPLLDDRLADGAFDEHWFASEPGAAAPTGVTPQAANAPLHGAQREARAGLPGPLGPSERLAAAWQDRLAVAASEAAQAGRLGASFRDTLDRLVQPRLPWRALLARFLMASGRDDYSFQRPGRREGAAMLPGLKSAAAELVVALDTSGSVTHADLREFLDEVDALRAQIHARVALLACDAALATDAPWRFEAWEPIGLSPDLDLAGGGGTRFTPVFEWVMGEALRPDALLYFTDAQGEFPRDAPDYPVLWLVKGSAPVPWGERVQLN